MLSPRATIFAESTAGPVATGHTLTQVYERAKTSSRPAKTGQTICYDANGDVIVDCTGTGQDGATLKGVTWPSTRFTDNSNGTVTDNLTGLIWLKAANYTSTGSSTEPVTWTDALSFCNALHTGQGGLTDGSTAGQWRLPNLRELQSLIDYGRSSPALPDHRFTAVQNGDYWSSTTAAAADVTTRAWFVVLSNGDVGYNGKTAVCYVWPVRGGQS